MPEPGRQPHRLIDMKHGAAAIGAAFLGVFLSTCSQPHARPAASPPCAGCGPVESHARVGAVTGYIDPCFALPPRGQLPYAAGTVVVHRGREHLKPAGPGWYRIVLGTVVSQQHIRQNQRFLFVNLPPGQYVLAAVRDHSNVTSTLDVSITAGEVVHRNIPNTCK